MITLKEAKAGCADKVTQKVIDEFRQSSPLLDKLQFDNCVNPTGGSTLTYGYLRTTTPSVAAFREIGKEYTAQEAKREKVSVDLKVFGGSFEVDRVIARTPGLVDEVDWQIKEKTKAAKNLFHYTLINGDSAVDGNSFDGLDKALLGSDTELGAQSYIDLSTSAAMSANYHDAMDQIEAFLSGLTGDIHFILANSLMCTKLSGLARRAGYYSHAENEFGKRVEFYNKIPILNMEYFTEIADGVAKETPVIKMFERSIKGSQVTGLTDIYAVSLGMDGLHGVSVSGNDIVSAFVPDFSKPGAVQKGEVEMIAAMALKRTRAAGVLRNVKIL